MAWYEVTLKYDKSQDNGTVKRVNDKFLADALGLTEAEAVVTTNVQPYVSGEFFATSAKETPITEIMGDPESGRFYLGKVGIITFDEKTATEKRTIIQVLVGAEDFKSAYNNLEVGMRPSMADWTLVSLSESSIKAVFEHA